MGGMNSGLSRTKGKKFVIRREQLSFCSSQMTVISRITLIN